MTAHLPECPKGGHDQQQPYESFTTNDLAGLRFYGLAPVLAGLLVFPVFCKARCELSRTFT